MRKVRHRRARRLDCTLQPDSTSTTALLYLRIIFAIILITCPLTAWGQSFITPDFKLHDPDPTLLRRTANIDSDTLGNFYVIWRQGVNEGVGLDGEVVVTKIRYDGTAEEAFVTIACDSTPGFGGVTGISVAPSGEHFAVSFSRFYEQHQTPAGLAAALPPREHIILQLFDSSGSTITPERWADSTSPDRNGSSETVILTPSIAAATWEDAALAGHPRLMQLFDLAGQHIGTERIYDSCETMTCMFSQSSRSDNYSGGFVVTWDESVLDFGASEQRPVFRIFDSLGAPVTPVMIGAHEPGYVADCGPSSPGFQSGYAPDVAMADNGEFMLVWSSCDGQYLDPWGAKPWGQIYYPDGTPKTGLILLADAAPGYVPFVYVTWGDDGNYYAVWADGRDCTPCFAPLNLCVQRISPNGALLGSNYVINDVLDAVLGSFTIDIAVSKGRACIVWQDWRDSYLYNDGEIFGQVISLDLIGVYFHGDVNLDYQFSSADIIYLVNYTFKSGPRPLPGFDYGDVNGDCVTNASDIIYYVNFVFKGGPGFIDACSLK